MNIELIDWNLIGLMFLMFSVGVFAGSMIVMSLFALGGADETD